MSGTQFQFPQQQHQPQPIPMLSSRSGISRPRPLSRPLSRSASTSRLATTIVKEVKNELKDYKKELQDLESDWKRAEKKKEATKEIKSLKKQLRECENKLHKQSTQMNTVGKLQQEVDESARKIIQLQQHSETLKSKLNECPRRLQQLQNEHSIKLQTNTTLADELSDLRRKIHQYQAQLKEVSSGGQHKERLAKCQQQLATEIEQFDRHQAIMQRKFDELTQMNQQLQKSLNQ